MWIHRTIYNAGDPVWITERYGPTEGAEPLARRQNKVPNSSFVQCLRMGGETQQFQHRNHGFLSITLFTFAMEEPHLKLHWQNLMWSAVKSQKKSTWLTWLKVSFSYSLLLPWFCPRVFLVLVHFCEYIFSKMSSRLDFADAEVDGELYCACVPRGSTPIGCWVNPGFSLASGMHRFNSIGWWLNPGVSLASGTLSYSLDLWLVFWMRTRVEVTGAERRRLARDALGEVTWLESAVNRWLIG